MITKTLKHATFEYNEKDKTLLIKNGSGAVILPRHYCFSLDRFMLRIWQRGKKIKQLEKEDR